MRHKYVTRAIILARYPVMEASSDIILLTKELGLVHARAQGVRKSGAKLVTALQTLAESEVVLVRGKKGWRISGAILDTSWFHLLSMTSRTRAGRVASLMLRLAPGEVIDSRFFRIIRDFFQMLVDVPDTLHESAECLVVLRFLHVLGLDDGSLPEIGDGGDEIHVLEMVEQNRSNYITRINRGITASGL